MSYKITMPSVHHVAKIKATMEHSGTTTWLNLDLTCQFMADDTIETFRFSLFPANSSVENFHRLATHINEIFSPVLTDPYETPEADYGEACHVDIATDELEYLADKAREEGAAS